MEKTILLVGESYHNANLYYKTRFLTNNQFIYLYHRGVGTIICATSDWERAKNESIISELHPYSSFDYAKHIKQVGHKDLAFLLMLKDVLNSYEIKSMTVPRDFPAFYANGLMKMGFHISIDCDLFLKERNIKSADEVQWIRETQQALEKGMASAEEIIRQSDVRDGVLIYEGKTLTNKRLSQYIEIALLKEDCNVFNTIVACGKNSSEPHYSGFSELEANEPILIDIFPFHKKNRYFADMTRTFTKGHSNPEIHDMYESVLRAQQKVISMAKAGVTANHIYETACDSFNRDGYLTLREQKASEPLINTGFLHSLGHGIGLDVHEPPFLFSQDIELRPGNVITIEPGLYNPELGGVRIEDIILIKEESCEVLSQYHKDFVIN